MRFHPLSPGVVYKVVSIFYALIQKSEPPIQSTPVCLCCAVVFAVLVAICVFGSFVCHVFEYSHHDQWERALLLHAL